MHGHSGFSSNARFCCCTVGLQVEGSKPAVYKKKLQFSFFKLVRLRKVENCPSSSGSCVGPVGLDAARLSRLCGVGEGQLDVSVLFRPPQLQLLEKKIILGSAQGAG